MIADDGAINIPIHETNKFSVREVGDGYDGGRQTDRSRSHSFLLAQVGTYYYTPPQRVSLFAYVDGTKTVSFILLMRFFCTLYLFPLQSLGVPLSPSL